MLRVRSTRSYAIRLLTFLAAVLAAAVVRGSPPVRHEFASPDIEPDVVGPLQPVAAKALEDTIWIADWSFDAGANCTDAGWVKYDNRILNTHVDSDFWHVDNRFNGFTDGAMPPNVLVHNKAAILSHHDLCWASDGYGNDNDFSIILKGAAGGMLSFNRVSDSEPSFDFVLVEADSLGLSESLANICTNPKRDAASFRTVLLINTGPNVGVAMGLTMPASFGAGTHKFYIRFVSDGGYSDEDGDYVTAISAGLVVDDIVVTGGIAYSENFEGALNANVSLVETANSVPFCAAPWVRLFSHITDNDKCTENKTCAWLGTDPLRVAFFPDMSFGPGQAVIHNWLDDIFVSPWVSLATTPSAKGTVLSFRRFAGNRFSQGLIVQGWRVRAKTKHDNTDTTSPGDSLDCVSPWGHASMFNSLNSFNWLTNVFDMTPHFSPNATEIQVS